MRDRTLLVLLAYVAAGAILTAAVSGAVGAILYAGWLGDWQGMNEPCTPP